MNKRNFWVIFGVLVFLLAAVAAYRIWPQLNPEVLELSSLNPACDLRAGPCSAEFSSGGSVSFSIQPREIPVVQPLTYEVSVDSLSVRRVEVDFQGTDMNMGYNRAELTDTGDGRFVGGGMLPVCVRSSMQWEAKILLHTDRGLLVAPFRFITLSSGN